MPQPQGKQNSKNKWLQFKKSNSQINFKNNCFVLVEHNPPPYDQVVRGEVYQKQSPYNPNYSGA